jgi:hypothetical protein
MSRPEFWASNLIVLGFVPENGNGKIMVFSRDTPEMVNRNIALGKLLKLLVSYLPKISKNHNLVQMPNFVSYKDQFNK